SLKQKGRQGNPFRAALPVFFLWPILQQALNFYFCNAMNIRVFVFPYLSATFSNRHSSQIS
ncbi:hypothetical protein, partial [uncultured Agathobaculum sp.]|uniref:hypothetical protein n=1 Tax=uncultured Agathobaculum sp. TaxID=2048140 RepID=UPI00320809AC